MIETNKIVSLRTCLLSNKQYDKSELIRLVKVNGKLIIDKDKNMQGRGYWIKITAGALDNPKTKQILSKRTKCNVDEDLLKALKEYENK